MSSMQKLLGLVANGTRAFVRTAASHSALLILSAPSTATRIVKLKQIDASGGCQPVYDLTVENHACYRANGILVSNSDAFRSLSQGFVPSKQLAAWPVFTAEAAPAKSTAYITAWIEGDAWAYVVCRLWRPGDEDCKREKLKEPRPSALVMATKAGMGMDSLLREILAAAKAHEAEMAWLPDSAEYELIRRQLWRQQVRVSHFDPPDPDGLAAVARQIAAERVVWVPDRKWSTALVLALQNYPGTAATCGALALATAVTYLRHRNVVLSQEDDEPIVIRRSKKDRGPAYA